MVEELWQMLQGDENALSIGSDDGNDSREDLMALSTNAI